MGGGLLQLVAYGIQDIQLTGTPEITYFKTVYRRYTNFAIEHIKQTFLNTIDETTKSTNVTISRSGDLMSNVWIESYFPSVTSPNNPTYISWCNNTGHAYIEDCELLIGGSSIDKHNSLYLDANNEFTDIDEKEQLGLNKHPNNLYMKNGNSNIAPELNLLIPLKFYFTQNYGQSIPLIALQYHEVELKFNFRPLKKLLVSDKTCTDAAISSPDTNLWVEYIFLDTAERKRFAQSTHTYLIQQVQTSEKQLETTNQINFHHPVKQLIWVITHERNESSDITIEAADPTVFKPLKYNDSSTLVTGTESVNGNDYFNYQLNSTDINHGITAKESGSCIYLNKTVDHFDTCTLKINSYDRFDPQKAIFFRYLQPLNYNKRIPKKHIYTYNFSLKSNEYQPYGTCNFSKIPQAILSFNKIGTESANRRIHIFAINYNLLVITNGMAGIRFAN
jgi:hypothetical protein